ncbi:hypothetical protein [Natrialba aegyptia]|uniref:Uncharacterized protein n=1 Tax=Natrialba aegyptia DSM 13077 TaxID=1227491 RepID=M0B4K3_9EURY|nr:hypothetical protein [Natrialba aegyptia]ELZ05755.1 hypothetical protein C480_10170 [Natrialba aegyptia DSM 13077]
MSDVPVDKLVRIVDYQSGNDYQPETAGVEHVTQVARNAGVPSADAKAAIHEALEKGRLEEADGRLKVIEE